MKLNRREARELLEKLLYLQWEQTSEEYGSVYSGETKYQAIRSGLVFTSRFLRQLNYGFGGREDLTHYSFEVSDGDRDVELELPRGFAEKIFDMVREEPTRPIQERIDELVKDKKKETTEELERRIEEWVTF